MKQIKFKQLATFGLCCSLLVNSLTGVTAVAETVTIESSPTAESTKESPKERTETSETTTETSREEATQETEKQEKVTEAETEAAQVEVEQEETETSEVIQPNPVPLPVSGIGVRAGNLASVHEQVTSIRIPPSGQVTITVPDIRLGVVLNSLDNVTLNTADFDIVAKGRTLRSRRLNTDPLYYFGAVINFETSKTNNSLDVLIPSRTLTAKYADPYTYDGSSYYMNPINLTVPKYIKAIGIKANQTYNAYYVMQPTLANGGYMGKVNPIITKKSAVNYELSSDTIYNFAGNTIPKLFYSSVDNANPEGQNGLQLFLPKQDIVVNVENRKVTENFKDVNGTAIPAPTDFTQGKQTSITNNDYTFTQEGTLPDTYMADGKTYKFKGWYKGKTKPETLETSKTPSYKVTYDDNDDLNVVYEETKAFEFPALTYQFGFVDESGQRVDASTIGLTYDNWYGELLTDNVADWQTITLEKGQVAPTKNNLKEITYPAQALERVAGKTSQYSAANLTFTLPKYYEKISVYNKTGTFDSAYPFPNIQSNNNPEIGGGSSWFQLKKSGSQSFVFNQTTAAAPIDIQVPSYLREIVHNPASIPTEATYYTIDKPIYYYLTNRKVTENFVDATGAKITAPTGFKQGKQTVIDSDDFTYTQEGTLPYIYKINNKPYVLKGWYKGKEKPAKLNQITKEKPNISYPVSYDDQDDVTVVYDELKLAGNTIQFGFVNEQGNYIPPTSKFNVSTDIGEVTNATYTKLQTVNSTINGNYLSLTIPAYNPTGGIGQGTEYYGSRNSIVTIPNYYKPPTLTPPSNYAGAAYPTATGVVDYHDAATYAYLPSRLNLTPVSGSQTNYRLPQAIWTDEETKTAFSSLYKMNATSTSETTMGLAEIYATGTVNYYLENRRVTENFVDDTGAKITPPADFTQGKQTVIDSDNFTYTSAKALPASYTADGKSYVLQGWYKGTEKPTTLETSKTPSYSVTYNDQDDLTVVYKEGTISADLTMRGAVDVIDNEAPMEYWEVLLKNTGEVPLTSIKIKPTTDWMSGISAPTELFILGTGQNAKARPITKEQWEAGFEIPLDSSLPVGGQLTINLIGTKVTGQPGQVLKAAVEVTGNFGNLKASDTVRIKDLDQEIKEPTGEGFISVPTFDFGQVGVASATKQHGLKKAADYYGNGTRNPYVRISKTQPNWSLTAQLSQPKSATDSLPTATRLLLGAAPVSSFSNYNQPTELKNAIGTTNAIHLTANNAATSIIANQQFTGSDVYQLDFTFDNIKLEVPANQGTAGQQYQAAVTWNLVTGP
ncbi:WxL domain-containing protein [Enterococcus faecalis]|uniref:WxL domain-containing protein n=1 Tax=Enterococcus faecalis TaxID=1351 RepID=UPI000815331F|nr:WxL domain-containing protein [Enterococcus faecalis]BAV37703.1 hypothetical protein EFW11_2464 [Enterococcus faecalis]